MNTEALATPVAHDPEQLLSVGRVVEITSLSKSYVYALSAQGKFPKSVPLVPGGSRRAWVSSEVYSWLRERIADRNQELVK